MWSLGLCRNIPAILCMWLHWSQQNEAQKQSRNFYIKFTFNCAIHCYSKMLLNPELLKTCVNAMNIL